MPPVKLIHWRLTPMEKCTHGEITGRDKARFRTVWDVVTVAAGKVHSLATDSDGKIYAWGDNSYGQSSVPDGLSDVIAVSAGANHSLALDSNGNVYAWGRNDYGQSTVPDGLENIIAVAAGENHSLALDSDGQIYAWGRSNISQSTVPDGLGSGISIAAAGDRSLLIVEDGLSTSADLTDIEAPSIIKLEQNYPNPFNPATNISFELPESSIVSLAVYNILGQQVAQLVNERKSSGRHEVNFDASGLSSGIYLYRLQIDSFTRTRQMMLVK